MVAPKPLLDIYDLVKQVEALPSGQPALVLALDEVTDPRNFGALIRVAAGAGVTAIIIPKVGSAGFSPAVGKASAGTLELMDIVVVPNLVDAMERLKKVGLWWVGATMDPKAITYEHYDFRGHTGIVLGSEGTGIRRLVKEHCDQLVYIPLATGVESLNVSVAGGILLFEALRQRRGKKSR
jgi:23S rRNA (guanosine2251-2'-O)-methyltransferase